jgi:SAM-dependent methyltransferase
MTTDAAIKELVRQRYGAIAEQGAKAGCCGPSSCGCDAPMAPDGLDMIGDAYAGIEGHVPEADLHLGCGVPTRHAGIRAGDTVLDLGAGAGNDAFVARRLVGPSGRVIGVDMTPAMIARARANAERLGYANVEFRLGEIEAMPVEAGSIDVAISNCVLNLVPDKARAFAELFRVLRPGGRFCISDIVATGPLPTEVTKAAALYVGCVAGAIPEADYLAIIRAQGFVDAAVVERKRVGLPDEALAPHMDSTALARFRAAGTTVLSVTVVGQRPHPA